MMLKYHVAKKKQIVRVKSHYLEQKRELVRPLACSVCGKPKELEMHHYSYEDPRNVIYVCSACHRNLHKEMKRREVENRYLIMI